MQFQRPRDRSILFFDMNSFFASVEQQANPALRGVPVGVSPVNHPSGCVIAASYEAKAKGIKVGDTVKEAKFKYPKVAIVESHPDKYRSINKSVMSVLSSFGKITVMSIDEAYIELPRDIDGSKAFDIAQGIKKGIANVGEWLKCSIGVSANVFLGKLAAESKKPDGYTELLLDDLAGFYAGIGNITDIPGINRGMRKRLARVGITTASEFFATDAETLRIALGIIGDYWWLRLRGYRVVDEVEFKTKSIGHQHVLSPEYRNVEKAEKVLRKLVERAAYRIRNEGYYARGVWLTIYVSGGYYNRRERVGLFNDSFTFWKIVSRWFEEQPAYGRPILSLSVSAFDLIQTAPPQFLFPLDEKRRVISEKMDEINERHGNFVIHPAVMHGAGADAAPSRIPFGKPRYD